MLSEKELKKIALNECVDMYGYDYIHAREDICCDCWGYEGDKYEYTLLTNEKNDDEADDYLTDMGHILIDETPFDYCATVYVDVNTGEVTRDYENSILPKK